MADPTDLLTLLAVARARTHTAAAAGLGVNHTTVARRLATLEHDTGQRLLVSTSGGWELTPAGRTVLATAEAVEAALATLPSTGSDAQNPELRGLVRVSCTELFGVTVAAPALADIHLTHPDISFELISVTRPAPQYGPTADLDVGVARPVSRRLEVRKILDYKLGLFAAKHYVERTLKGNPPRRLADLAGHSPIYYVESMLQVTELDIVDRFFPRRGELLGATSVLAQHAMARAGAGIAILPVYLARSDTQLVQLLSRQATATLTYWMSGRPENLRRPEVQTTAAAILQRSVSTIPSLNPRRGRKSPPQEPS